MYGIAYIDPPNRQIWIDMAYTECLGDGGIGDGRDECTVYIIL